MENENKALIEISLAQQALDKANTITELVEIRDRFSALSVFANAKGQKDTAQKAKIYQLKAERKAGEWLDKNVEHQSPFLKSQDATSGLPEGVDKHESSRWQQEAKVSEKVFNGWVGECLEKGKEITASELRRMASNTHVSDDSYEWYTPKEYIDVARTLMGSIDLDPASSDEAQSIIKANTFYTKETDGLSQPWFGNVWLNPPYNMPTIELFVTLAIEYYKNKQINSAVILTNNSTDTKWFHNLLNYPVCFTLGRIKFWSANQILATRQGQALFYLGNDIEKFSNLFSNFGTVLIKL